MSYIFSTFNVFATSNQTSIQTGASSYSPIIILFLFGALMYFILWRPQNKKIKEHKKMIHLLKIGDEVITSGGIYGKILNIFAHTIELSVSENVSIVIQKSSITYCLPKGSLKNINKVK